MIGGNTLGTLGAKESGVPRLEAMPTESRYGITSWKLLVVSAATMSCAQHDSPQACPQQVGMQQVTLHALHVYLALNFSLSGSSLSDQVCTCFWRPQQLQEQ